MVLREKRKDPGGIYNWILTWSSSSSPLTWPLGQAPASEWYITSLKVWTGPVVGYGQAGKLPLCWDGHLFHCLTGEWWRKQGRFLITFCTPSMVYLLQSGDCEVDIMDSVSHKGLWHKPDPRGGQPGSQWWPHVVKRLGCVGASQEIHISQVNTWKPLFHPGKAVSATLSILKRNRASTWHLVNLLFVFLWSLEGWIWLLLPHTGRFHSVICGALGRECLRPAFLFCSGPCSVSWFSPHFHLSLIWYHGPVTFDPSYNESAE